MMLSLFLVAGLYADTCPGGYGDPVVTGSVADSPIVEASGLAWSRSRPGVWFTHNDAGGRAEIHAFTLDGSFVETHDVPDAFFADWEDLSGGPCPDPADGSCLYVGDIGDNGHTRSYIWVHAVREPLAGEEGQVVATWKATYPDGPEDAETLFVHPFTGRIYLVTKSYDSVAQVYRFQEPPSEDPLDLEWIATLDFDAWGASSLAATGGDWDPTADRLVIRTYSHAFEWVTDPCDPDGHWSQVPTLIRTSDPQGEAIAYDDQGDLITVSEGDPAASTRIACLEDRLGGGDCFDTAVEGVDPRGRASGGCQDAEPDAPLLPSAVERHRPGVRYRESPSAGCWTSPRPLRASWGSGSALVRAGWCLLSLALVLGRRRAGRR